jgi:hypothetical protein
VDLDPYRAPSAEGSLPSPPPGPKLPWKIYAGVRTISFVFIYTYFASTRPAERVFLDSLAILVALVGLFGYAYRWRLGSRWLWAAVAVGYTGYDLLDSFVFHRVLNAAGTIAYLALVGPHYAALLLYAFRSPLIWAPGAPEIPED